MNEDLKQLHQLLGGLMAGQVDYRKRYQPNLNIRELSAILAGLRLIQITKNLPPEILAIFDDEQAIVGLSNKEIDLLCEHLSTPVTTKTKRN